MKTCPPRGGNHVNPGQKKSYPLGSIEEGGDTFAHSSLNYLLARYIPRVEVEISASLLLIRRVQNLARFFLPSQDIDFLRAF